MEKPLTKKDLLRVLNTAPYKTYEDFAPNSNEYFALLALETCGSSVRDNSLAELVAIGKDIETNGVDRYI